MQKRIQRRDVSELPAGLAEYTPWLQRIYAARGVVAAEALTQKLSDLLPYQRLMGLEKALVRLYEAFVAQSHVLIVGDFDADGATSCAVAVSALRQMGLKQVSYLVPNRFDFGYGLTPEIVEVAAKQKPDVLVTVDNGIASIEGVARANALGIDVIVTDHHLPGDALPDAIAIVNPNQTNCTFESKALAGVGVIFYVMIALRAYLREQAWFESRHITPPNLAALLDIVALGTVADVVPLDTNNRILVHQGLARIRAGRARPGINALMKVSKREASQLQAADLGFALGPRLNAAGRLEDMSLGIACLLASNEQEALSLATQLNDLNVSRREIEQEMKQQALVHMADLQLSRPDLPRGICFYQADWHQGVIGILASRIKDMTGRPVIAFANDKDGLLKGSARSILGLNIRDALDVIDKKQPGLILKFGGHAGAAGLSIDADKFNTFQDAFETHLNAMLSEEDCTTVILSDGALAPEDFSVNFAKTLQTAGPWGQQFPEAIFDNQFILLDQRLIAERHLKLTLAHPDVPHKPLQAIAFNIDLSTWPNYEMTQIHCAYKLNINYYQGFENLQLMVEHLVPKFAS